MDLEKIGLFIAKMRKKKKLTQQELANKLGVTDKAISNWENGRRMPDVSIYKDLCKELDISLNELINGEIETKEMTRDNVDNIIIKTLNYNEENKKKLNKIIKILILILCFLVIIIGWSYYSYRKRYPKIDIYNISIVDNQTNKLVDQLIPTNDGGIMYYSLDSVHICNANDKCFDLLTALINKQTSISKIRRFLDKQAENNYLKKFDIYDNRITTYKSNIYDINMNINKKNQFEVIFCNNTNQVYFGKMHMENELQGNYCGILDEARKEFIRTYKIVSITPDHAEEYVNVTLQQFQLDTVMVKVPSKFNIEVGKNYEFTFTTYETFEDTIENIFKYTTIKKVKETDKIGLDQIQEPMSINHKN